MRESAKKLLIMQLTYDGIPEDVYHFLPEGEKAMLIERGGRFYLNDNERRKIKVGLTGGVFDVLHIGHIMTLLEAKKHCDLLVVAIAKDDHVRKKGREPIHPQEYRKTIVESIKPVDIAISGFDNPKKMVEFVKPDVIVFGYDQSVFIRPDNVEIVKLERKIDDSKFKSGKILEELGL